MSDEARKRGRASKRKGKSYEREVAKFLEDVFPEAARGRSQSIHDKTFKPDVDGTPFWVECKNRKQTNPRAAVLQGEAEAAEVEDPRPSVAFCKDDPIGGRKVEWVMMRPETFLDLCRKAYGDTEAAPCAESKLNEVRALITQIMNLLG